MPRIKFRKLGLLYILALSGIALSLVISQVVVQKYISRQQNDSRIINIAGRQRMLSQKITKLCLIIQSNPADAAPRNELRATLDEWQAAHSGLQSGSDTLLLDGKNSAHTDSLFARINPYFTAIQTAGRQILQAEFPEKEDLDQVLANEALFLALMDEIVSVYESEAYSKVVFLRQTEYIILAIGLAIILLELLFIFRPLARNIRGTVNDLISSREETASANLHMSKLYEELARSYQDLEAVQTTPERFVKLATMDETGTFSEISDTFRSIMQRKDGPFPPLAELLYQNNYQEYFISGLQRMVNEGRQWSGEIRLSNTEGDFCWVELYIIPIKPENNFKVIGRDVTHLKEAQMRSQEINHEKIEQKVREMNYRSSLILEGQEEERKRLSRELHDGVGQMLSALKLSLESIIPSGSAHMKNRLNDSKDLLKSIIQEVRRVSFNLTPSSLDDFGLVPAVKKFCDEIDSVTKTSVTFRNETRFINRLSSTMETNLYRIIQEAVNNALKYAQASAIDVSFHHVLGKLTIEISDNGKGFDLERLENSGHMTNAGHGLFNMRERAAFIGAGFKITSTSGSGTIIRIVVSLE